MEIDPEEKTEQQQDQKEDLMLYRCLKAACHGLCFILGMTNCPHFECLMNSDEWIESKPFALCPICLRKLDAYCEIGDANHNDGGGIIERY